MKTGLDHHPARAVLHRRRGEPVSRTLLRRRSAAPVRFMRILVPVDFTAGSETALRYASSLAQQHRARVLPIHVTPPICFTVDCGYGPVNRTVPDEDSLRQMRTRLQRLVHGIVPAALADEVTVCTGEPIQQIIEAAAEREADLIVMLGHDALGGKSAPPTHTVDRLVRAVHCPVLVVHAYEPSRKRPLSNRERTR